MTPTFTPFERRVRETSRSEARRAVSSSMDVLSLHETALLRAAYGPGRPQHRARMGRWASFDCRAHFSGPTGEV